MFLVAVCVLFLLIGGAAQAGEPPAPGVEYVVDEGDTLWAIASAVTRPDEDVRVTITFIKRLSGIESSTLHPGQTLLLPQG